ncbi:response regulator [Roseicyclus sp. F158]|uniref:Response regulator n=1 Tax=Tropicimonas omnivorans TaxID=3075590 RepID=A0ABU3DKB4_9RHOB|nr:response regulator [Roseicyclus sp. F158]MDT0684157.1 response regulator [Roseicyclus sp. F158]
MSSSETSAEQRTIMIVEDDWLIADDLAHTVKDIGYRALGPAHSVSAALDILGKGEVDAALLDVNLRGETSYPVADAMAEQGIPFAFLSGYTTDQLKPGFQDRPLLSKPLNPGALRDRLSLMLRE